VGLERADDLGGTWRDNSYPGRLHRRAGPDTEGSVWTAGGCLSWYRDDTGRNSTLWPGSVRDYERRLARFEIGDYETELPRRTPEREPAYV
jgi:hypothetical protein